MTEQQKEHFVDEALEEIIAFVSDGTSGDLVRAIERLCQVRGREVPVEVRYASAERQLSDGLTYVGHFAGN